MPDPINWGLSFPFFALAFFIGYGLGSIPFGFLFTKYISGRDIRKEGSGNIGATNVLRTGKKPLALLTLLCDGGKGYLVVACGLYWGGTDIAFFAALGAFSGHLFPIWLLFRGGKGIATYIGILLALSPFSALGFLLIWIIIFFLWRLVSLASIIACLAVPIFMYMFSSFQFVELSLLLSILCIWAHRENIVRIMRGEEKPISLRK
ncbi:MAG: glycerol-3-phosphate 1-O-acyltransferase PlsY [Parvibaculales bacterium]